MKNLSHTKCAPPPVELPGKFETGTQNHEGIAGILGAIEYFEWVRKEFGGEYADELKQQGYTGRTPDSQASHERDPCL
ncbi:MAG: hypothetical protein U0V18_11125 [Anaerolineales bacterium]